MSNFEKLKTFEPLASSLTIKKVSIHGLGLFATCEIPKHNELGISHVKMIDFLTDISELL